MSLSTFAESDSDPSSMLVPREEVEAICRISQRAISNIKLILPHFSELLKERQNHPNDAAAITSRRVDVKLFQNMLHQFESAYNEHCSQDSSSAGRVSNHLAEIRSRPKHSTKSFADFQPVMLALPFHSLLEVAVQREQEFAAAEKEYMTREAEMTAYTNQVRKHGLAGGVTLKEPMEYWDERIRKLKEQGISFGSSDPNRNSDST